MVVEEYEVVVGRVPCLQDEHEPVARGDVLRLRKVEGEGQATRARWPAREVVHKRAEGAVLPGAVHDLAVDQRGADHAAPGGTADRGGEEGHRDLPAQVEGAGERVGAPAVDGPLVRDRRTADVRRRVGGVASRAPVNHREPTWASAREI